MNPPPMQQRINFNPNQQQPQFQNFQQQSQRPQQIQGNLPPPSYSQQAPLVNGFNATPASSHQMKNVSIISLDTHKQTSLKNIFFFQAGIFSLLLMFYAFF